MQLAHLIAALVLALLPGGQTHPTAGRQEFVGSTPCDAEPRRFFGISGTVPCERITWQLALAEKQDRSTFSLQIVYGMRGDAGRGIRNAKDAHFEPVPAAFPSAAGVFEGRTPCREVAGRLNPFRIGSDCMKLKWKLTLHQDAVTGAPTRYVLEGTAYRSAPRMGTWAVLRKRSDPGRIVYVLDPGDTQRSLSFVRADHNILLFAGEDGSPLVGDGYFSYTLNRVAGSSSAPGYVR